MAREFDPNNLSGGDVLRLLGPIVGVVIATIVVGKYAPQYFWLLLVPILAFIMYGVRSMPRESLEAIADRRQQIREKIRSLPYVGPMIYPLWRVFGWLNELLSIAILLLLIYLVYKGAT